MSYDFSYILFNSRAISVAMKYEGFFLIGAYILILHKQVIP